MRKIIHIDMDAFFASVEQRDNPELRGCPVIVGGSPQERGVVAAASYEARKFGIHSAMPSRMAAAKCPAAVFVRPRFEVYRSISEQIHEIFHRYTDLVEPLSLDEAYLDVTVNKASSASATVLARQIRAAIFEETSLTASAGVSMNKFLAKSASRVNKPNGLFVIPPEQSQAFLESLPIEEFHGIGAVTAGKMRRLGINNGTDLKRWSETDLIREFGRMGSYFFHIVRGRDDRPVIAHRIRKSIGAEESFTRDLENGQDINAALSRLCSGVADRLARAQTAGRTLTLKVKYADYRQITRSRTVAGALRCYADIFPLAAALLSCTEAGVRKVRLLGVTVSNLSGEEPDQAECLQLTLNLFG